MSNFLENYAGVYEIEVAGTKIDDAESYTLFPDGTAEWDWLRSSKYTEGPPGTTKKGHWTAHAGHISITIIGGSGPITEEYHNFRLGDRYLRKIE